jgi:hypothetical protein
MVDGNVGSEEDGFKERFRCNTWIAAISEIGGTGEFQTSVFISFYIHPIPFPSHRAQYLRHA